MLGQLLQLIQRAVVLILADHVAVLQVRVLRSVAPDAEHSTLAAADGATVAGIAIEILVKSNPLLIHLLGLHHRQLNRSSGLIDGSLPILRADLAVLGRLDDVVPPTMGVDHLIASIRQSRSSLTAALLMPIGDLHTLGHGRHIGGVVERTRRHTGTHDDIGAAGQEGCHIRAGIAGLIGAEMEEFAAFTREVSHIFLQQGIAVFPRCFIVNIQITAAGIFGAIHDRRGMTGHVQHGNDLNALAVGIGDNGIHVNLIQIPRITVEAVVAVGDIALDLVAGHSNTLKAETHVVQQETAAAVAEGELELVIAVLGHGVDQLLDIGDAEILAAAVQHDRAISHIADLAARKSRRFIDRKSVRLDGHVALRGQGVHVLRGVLFHGGRILDHRLLGVNDLLFAAALVQRGVLLGLPLDNGRLCAQICREHGHGQQADRHDQRQKQSQKLFASCVFFRLVHCSLVPFSYFRRDAARPQGPRMVNRVVFFIIFTLLSAFLRRYAAFRRPNAPASKNRH